MAGGSVYLARGSDTGARQVTPVVERLQKILKEIEKNEGDEESEG